jgi:hypothetical protein
MMQKFLRIFSGGSTWAGLATVTANRTHLVHNFVNIYGKIEDTFTLKLGYNKDFVYNASVVPPAGQSDCGVFITPEQEDLNFETPTQTTSTTDGAAGGNNGNSGTNNGAAGNTNGSNDVNGAYATSDAVPTRAGMSILLYTCSVLVLLVF